MMQYNGSGFKISFDLVLKVMTDTIIIILYVYCILLNYPKYLIDEFYQALSLFTQLQGNLVH